MYCDILMFVYDGSVVLEDKYRCLKWGTLYGEFGWISCKFMFLLISLPVNTGVVVLILVTPNMLVYSQHLA